MGVQGLASFIDSYRQIYRDVRFRNSRLVIDGCNLLYLLYFDSGLDQNHGGEYAAYKELIVKFVTALRDCGIEPYVVLDGGSDYTDKKLETLKKRAQERIKRTHEAAMGGGQKNILPQLVKLVFRQTLAQLEVPVAQCYGEADTEIAALANKWQCPVLSNDSDFYIFNLLAGLLPISHFQWKAVVRSGSKSYILCQKYMTSSFCTYFNIQPQLLPTFAALAGNDYMNLRRMELSISWIRFSPAGSVKPSHLEGLVCWLRGFNQPEKALDAALGLMGELSNKKRAEVLNGLYLGMGEYKLPPSSLEKFFISGTAPPFPEVEEVAGLVPEWIRLPLMQGRLTPDTLDVLLLQRMGLSFPVDHANMPSANLTSRPLRQVMYGLLLGKGRQLSVEETDRDGLQLRVIQVQPAFTGVTKQLELNSLNKAEPSQRLQVLLKALGVKEASLSCLAPQLRLLVAVTYYWLQRAQPPPSDGLLKALLIGLSNGATLRHRAALQIQNQHINQELDVRMAHAFNQWQACLKDSIHLNQLLGFPLPEPEIARLYEGTLVHHLVHRMRTGKLKALLKFNPSGVKVYRATLAVIHQLRTQETSTLSNIKKKATALLRRPPDDLTVYLKQLFLQYEDMEEVETEVSSLVRAQEDLQLHESVSVKTRYRTKERNNRSHNPELIRKEDRRGPYLL